MQIYNILVIFFLIITLFLITFWLIFYFSPMFIILFYYFMFSISLLSFIRIHLMVILNMDAYMNFNNFQLLRFVSIVLS